MISLKNCTSLIIVKKAVALFLVLLCISFASLTNIIQSTTVQQAHATSGWPTTPPAQICGSSMLNNGPTTAPQGAVTVPAGDNSSMLQQFSQDNQTFWFEPGTHTIGTGMYNQIAPGDNTTFIGAPGAIIDGQDLNNYAFTGESEDVTIQYLTIKNFNAPRDEGVVNHNAAVGWTIQYSTIIDNQGAGLMAGSDNLYQYNCMKDNGQYAINSCCGEETPEGEIQNWTLDHNEIVGNNTEDWETQVPGCGCTGGVKFWLNKNVTVTNNYVHDNHGTGIWLDNNNRGFIIENNYIKDNNGPGLFIEAGYDASVRYNNFIGNAVGTGKEFADRQDPFPIGAIYISDAGSPAGYNLVTSPMIVSNNNFENNWGGVVLWENADRYSGSTAHTHVSGTIKVGTIYDDDACDGPNDTIPSTVDDKYKCRWSTENVIVEDNEFSIDKDVVGTGCAGGTYCGINGIFSNVGSYPEFSGYTIPWRITFQQNNIFRNNNYHGDWRFAGFQTTKPDGGRVTWSEWTAAAPQVPQEFTNENRPTTFGQDQGSTYDGPTITPTPTATPTPTISATPTPSQTVTGNSLDNDTAHINNTKGTWANWFSVTTSRDTNEKYTGTGSLKIEATDQFWGVESTNWQGFPASPGNKKLSYWVKKDTSNTVGITLQAKWLNSNGDLLQTDELSIASIGTNWEEAVKFVTAPAGTAKVLVTFVHNTGNNGDIIYVDDIYVGSAPNNIDPASTTMDSSKGTWADWFSVTTSHAINESHRGDGSLKIEITDQFWGVESTNWQGFTTTPGQKRLSYWAKKDSSNTIGMTMEVKWLNSNGDLLQTDTLSTSSLASSWSNISKDVVAPSGTAKALVTFVHNTGHNGDIIYVDDIYVGQSPNYLDNETATADNSKGTWTNWFSVTTSHETTEKHEGAGSLKIAVADQFWGVETTNWQGFQASSGDKRLSFWAKKNSSNTIGAQLEVKWLDSSNSLLQTDTVTLSTISTNWEETVAYVTAPTGTARAVIDFVHNTGNNGDILFIDDIYVGEIVPSLYSL